MPHCWKSHGYLAAVCISLAGASRTAGQQPISTESRRFDIAYSVPEDALPLDSVELWYRPEGQREWERYGLDADRRSPITFEAPEDGRYDLFLVLTNATGPSSHAPSPTTAAQLSVFVDATAPIVQLHDVRQSKSLGARVVQIRWTAVDANLPPRPVEIAYQVPPESTWHAVTAEPMANTGRYDWRVPDDLVGSVAVRVSVTDAGGHHVSSEPVEVQLNADTDVVERGDSSPSDVPVKFVADPGGLAVSGSKRARQVAKQLYQEALQFRDRGQYRDGISRLREAVRLDPGLTQGFVTLGSMLFALGDSDRALAAYQIALKQEPNLRSALAGAASIYAHKKDYNKSADLLRTILRYDPSDAEMWMALGDVAVYQGDEMLARESYLRAAQVDPSAITVVEEARKRLALMAEVSRKYDAVGP